MPRAVVASVCRWRLCRPSRTECTGRTEGSELVLFLLFRFGLGFGGQHLHTAFGRHRWTFHWFYIPAEAESKFEFLYQLILKRRLRKNMFFELLSFCQRLPLRWTGQIACMLMLDIVYCYLVSFNQIRSPLKILLNEKHPNIQRSEGPLSHS